MLLSDLVEHIPVQREAISKLSVLDSTTEICISWNEFREGLWGKGLESFHREEPVERDDDPIKPVHFLPDAPPATRSVAIPPKSPPGPWNLHNPKILVRSDYKGAEEALLSACSPYRSAFVVCGQPGIGKSVFLLWLLMCRLALRLPTALQIEASYAILFHEGGVSQFTNLDDHCSYCALDFPPEEHLRRIWVLIDFNQNLPKIPNIFRYSRPFFAVCTVSPDPHRHRWLEKVGYKWFYMKPWSILEVVQVRSFLGEKTHSERQLLYLYRQFGASTRTLALYGARPDVYEKELEREINLMEPDNIHRIFRDPGSSENSYYIVTIFPKETNRYLSEKVFASRYVFDMVWEKHLSHRVDIMEEFHHLFLQSSTAAAAVGWIFERRMHQLLMGKRTIRLFPVRGRHMDVNFVYDNYAASKVGVDPTELQLTGSRGCRLVEMAKLEKNRYYLAKPTEFPTIDSLYLLHPPGEPSPILLIFRITRSERKHHVKLCGLRKIDQLDIPVDIQRYYVVATPEHIRPEIAVPVKYFEKERDGEVDEIWEEGIGGVQGEDLDGPQYEDIDGESGGDMDDPDDMCEDRYGEMDGDGLPPSGGFPVFHFPVELGQLFEV